MVELTANRPNPLFLPAFSLPCCIPVPSQEEKCKELEWGWGKKWSGCISAEVYLAVAITPLESLKASFTNLQVGTAFPSLLFSLCKRCRFTHRRQRVAWQTLSLGPASHRVQMLLPNLSLALCTASRKIPGDPGRRRNASCSPGAETDLDSGKL